MEPNIISYRTGNSDLISYNKPISSRFQKSVDLSDQKEDGFFTFTIKTSEIDAIIDQMNYRKHFNDLRDHYCFTAIRNLIKKNEFLQLSIQLAENLITEDEFESELENNPEKYVIKLEYFNTPADLHIIGDVLHNIGKQFTVDEVSELFSIETTSLNNSLKTLEYKQ